jgi:hypothetical protein
MSNDNEQIIEDVEEKDLVESEATAEEVVEETATEEVEETEQEEVSEETEIAEEETEEVVEETAEEVSEEAEEVEEETQPLSDTVLDVLLGEAKKTKAEAEEEDSEAEEDDDDEELEEAKKVKEEEEESDEEEDEDESEVAEEDEVKEGAHEDEDEEDEDEELPEVTTKAGYLAASFGALKGMRKSELVAAYQAINPIEEGEHETEEGYHEEMPKTKAELINAMYGQLKAMKKDPLMASYKSIMASHCESVEEDTEADLFAEDLKVLADADQELTEDFKSKASILFEAAVANKVNTIKEELEAEYAADLQEEVTYVRESLIEKIDDYLSFVVESWIEENQEFVDNKLRVEITENFMKALQNTFTEHYIEVPDSKVDLVDDLSEQVTEIKESLANVSAEKEELARQVEELSREKIISEASTDLASTEAGKLASLVEETEFVDSETFAAKVATIKEGFFKESTETEEVLTETVDSAETEVKTIVEGEISQEAKLPKDMAKYVTHLSRFK